MPTKLSRFSSGTLARCRRKRVCHVRASSELSKIDVFADLTTIDLADSTRWKPTSGGMNQIATASSGIAINSGFDSGNVDCVNINDLDNIELRIREDPFCENDGRAHYQWFYFRVTGAKGKALTLNITNAGGASYPDGWQGYDACCSYDRMHWFRVPSSYDAASGVFTIRHTPEHGAVFYSYFAPYTYERHLQLISDMQMNGAVKVITLGHTPDGHDLDLLVVGDEAPGKKKVWVIARQHPGESMAEWFVEGLLQRLTDRHDSVARDLLENQATLYVVPNMNPDGAWRGYQRTDVNGYNMNRAWAGKAVEEVASVGYVLRKMKETGVDLFIDVHGDEVLPHNFIACAEGTPSWNDKMARCKESFCGTLTRAYPAFQTTHGYEIDAPNTADMSIATNRVAEEFGCFSMTVEQPYKDCQEHPDPECGWSPERCKRFGASFLSAIRQILPLL